MTRVGVYQRPHCPAVNDPARPDFTKAVCCVAVCESGEVEVRQTNLPEYEENSQNRRNSFAEIPDQFPASRLTTLEDHEI